MYLNFIHIQIKNLMLLKIGERHGLVCQLMSSALWDRFWRHWRFWKTHSIYFLRVVG